MFGRKNLPAITYSIFNTEMINFGNYKD